MDTKLVFLFTLLGATVLGLSIYLGVLLRKLREQKKFLEQTQEAARESWRRREGDIRGSLQTLALVIIQDQCEPTEGCIRVKKLVDEIDYLKDRQELAVFHEMYEEVKEFAILDDYKSLSKQEKFRQDNKRFSVEEKYNARLKKASKDLRDILARPH